MECCEDTGEDICGCSGGECDTSAKGRGAEVQHPGKRENRSKCDRALYGII